jgi:hypothetical protein
MTPAWFKLLMEWQGAGRFGLTVPFVYGALSRMPEGPLRGASGSEKLQSLLASLVDDVPDGNLIRLFFCGTVHDLTLAPIFAVPDYCLSIQSSDGRKVSFYVQQCLLPPESASPMSDLHSELWRRYGEVLEAGRFSLRNGRFEEFSERDLALVDTALSRPDNNED